MQFYLGSHIPNWLEKTDTPLFISQRQLAKRTKTLPQSLSDWYLDSGGFSELSMFGKWETSPQTYVASIKRYISEIGNLKWASQQDYMCEPFMLEKTKMTVVQHQQKTVENFIDLKMLDDNLPIIPVLQGWSNSDYLKHIEMFDIAGVNLFQEKVVGIGSVCRRQNFKSTQDLVRQLYGLGLKLHGFGVKLLGLKQLSECFVSTDSMAWSYGARYSPPLETCQHKNCANCLIYAELWYEKVMELIRQPKQMYLFY